MPSTARPRRAGRDKSEVLTAAVRVIADRGAEATRFTDVAAASGVPVSTLQYYFGSREDLLVAAFRHASGLELTALRTALPALPSAWARLTHLVTAALDDFPALGGASGRLWIEAWRFALRDEQMREYVLTDYTDWRGLIADAVREGVAAGEFTTTLTADAVAVVVLALLDGMGLPLALGDPTVPRADAREACLHTLAALLGVA